MYPGYTLPTLPAGPVVRRPYCTSGQGGRTAVREAMTLYGEDQGGRGHVQGRPYLVVYREAVPGSVQGGVPRRPYREVYPGGRTGRCTRSQEAVQEAIWP